MTAYSSSKIGFIGAGNMGEALIAGIIEGKIAEKQNIFIFDASPDRIKTIASQYGVSSCASNKEIVNRCDKIFFAVKPQFMQTVLDEIAGEDVSGKIFISICAGIKIENIENNLKNQTAVIRVMPNTPALIKCGASALAKGRYATNEDLQWCIDVFAKIGIAVVVEEDMLDAVTGLSGSGPAYVFRLIEAMIQGGVESGLPADIAERLAKYTLLGAARLAIESPKSPSELREAVTSPGGTTQAGLKVMLEAGFFEIIVETVKRATARSKELAKH